MSDGESTATDKLASFAENLAKNQVELDLEAKRALYTNLWDLYDREPTAMELAICPKCGEVIDYFSRDGAWCCDCKKHFEIKIIVISPPREVKP